MSCMSVQELLKKTKCLVWTWPGLWTTKRLRILRDHKENTAKAGSDTHMGKASLWVSLAFFYEVRVKFYKRR